MYAIPGILYVQNSRNCVQTTSSTPFYGKPAKLDSTTSMMMTLKCWSKFFIVFFLTFCQLAFGKGKSILNLSNTKNHP